jgi:hypothetical protein
MEPEGSLPHSNVPSICPYPEPAMSYQSNSPGPRLSVWTIRNMIRFYGEELAPRPTPELQDHPLSAVRDWLFNIFAAILHIGGRYEHNGTRHTPRHTLRLKLLTIKTQTQYIPGQHDSSINVQSVYTATTQTDFIRIVATKLF